MTYLEFIRELQVYAEEDFANFQRRLIFTKYKILGVRTPILRKFAKRYKNEFSTLFSFPNEYYETVFIKLAVASFLPYEQFLPVLERCVALIDNWALCDCFKAKCIRENRTVFLSKLEDLFKKDEEYFQRYVLVVLLAEYMEKDYLPTVKEYLSRANTKPYYVHMTAAWLTAEILVKNYEYGVALLQEKILDTKTHNKAKQKAIESYRLTDKQKEYLRSLKIK